MIGKSSAVHIGDRNWQKKVRAKLMAMPDKINSVMSFYLSLPPSVNKIYATDDYGKRRLTKEGREWKKETNNIAYMEALRQGWKMCFNTKVIVELRVFWPNASRARDMNNLHKLLADALEKVIYHNDKLALIRDMDFGIDGKNPRLELKIYQMGAEENG